MDEVDDCVDEPVAVVLEDDVDDGLDGAERVVVALGVGEAGSCVGPDPLAVGEDSPACCASCEP